jgi:hypothetical protein
MSKPIKNIVLEFPCREQWDKLEIVAGGRLCHSCVHVVRDFRDCSQSELNSVRKTESHVCGIFSRNQLSPAFVKAATVALAATVLSACETEQPKPTVDDVAPQLITSELPPIEEDVYFLGIVVSTVPDSVQSQRGLE